MRGWVQVAGIRHAQEARACLEAGADLLGFPFRLPVHKEDLPEEEAARLIHDLGISSRAVLITYLEDADAIQQLADELGCAWVQIHGHMDLQELERLRALDSRRRLMRSLVLRGDNVEAALATLRGCEAHVDAFLTDTHDPRSGADGATGLTHDWRLSRRLRLATSKPLMLAGGLRPDNVAQAIAAVGPAGVDAHTGLEDALGAKDPALVMAFVEASRKAFLAMEAE